jgi:hypothetical protein
MNASDQQDERDAVNNTGGEITAAISAIAATEEDEEKALFEKAALDTEDIHTSAQEEQSPAVDSSISEAGVLPPDNASRVQEPPREESHSLAPPAASGVARHTERAAERRRRQRNNDDPASNKAAYFSRQHSSGTDAPSNLTEDLLSPDDQGANDGISENFALLQGHMTPVRPGALVVSAAAPTSKTAPEPLGSSHTRPGAYTAFTRAFGDRPAWHRANVSALMVRAELVPSQPYGEGVETGEAPLTTSLERDVAPVVEVNPAVIAVAAPIDTKREYYYMAGVLLLVAAFATALGVVIWGQEKYERNEKDKGGSDDPPAQPPPYLPSGPEKDEITPLDIPWPIPGTILAYVPATICYERNPGAGRSEACSVNATLEQGGGVTNLVAQACLEHFPNADMAIHNAGRVRDDIVEGNFTVADIGDLLPYETLILLNMAGSDIKLVLEQALEFVFAKPKSTGAYPYAAGLKFAVNMTAEFGNRLSDMQVKERVKDTWESLDPSIVYAVVANSYIAGGQDGYWRFGEISKVEESEKTTAEIFLAYAEAQDVLLDPPLEDYSTISYIPP